MMEGKMIRVLIILLPSFCLSFLCAPVPLRETFFTYAVPPSVIGFTSPLTLTCPDSGTWIPFQELPVYSHAEEQLPDVCFASRRALPTVLAEWQRRANDKFSSIDFVLPHATKHPGEKPKRNRKDK